MKHDLRPHLIVILVLSLIAWGLLGLRRLDDTLLTGVMLTAAANKLVVVLDPGHGGEDGGAQANGINEKEINLILAKKERLLCQLFGFQVVMTREDDRSIHDQQAQTIREQKTSDLHNRLALMTSYSGSIAVSIHLNKFTQSYVHGAQVFYAPRSSGSERLAETIQEGFRQYLQPDNTRQIKPADQSLFLLDQNTVTPGVLVECGFISNPEEAAQLQDTEYQDQIAMVICHSLIKFYSGGEEPVGTENES